MMVMRMMTHKYEDIPEENFLLTSMPIVKKNPNCQSIQTQLVHSVIISMTTEEVKSPIGSGLIGNWGSSPSTYSSGIFCWHLCRLCVDDKDGV